MKLPGWCAMCRKIKRVNVVGPPTATPIGECDACRDAAETPVNNFKLGVDVRRRVAIMTPMTTTPILPRPVKTFVLTDVSARTEQHGGRTEWRFDVYYSIDGRGTCADSLPISEARKRLAQCGLSADTAAAVIAAAKKAAV